MAKNSKYYVVWIGRNTGVFETWEECRQQTENFPNAKFKAYPSESLAKQAFNNGEENVFVSKESHPNSSPHSKSPIIPSLTVDGATSGNPGPSEYRAVYTHSLAIAFAVPPFYGTNNIAEFLAIVHAMAWMDKEGIRMPIYSDSKIAISWVEKGICRSLLPLDDKSAQTMQLVQRAERWLRLHPPRQRPPLLKWQTHLWGEIPADYGRK